MASFSKRKKRKTAPSGALGRDWRCLWRKGRLTEKIQERETCVPSMWREIWYKQQKKEITTGRVLSLWGMAKMAWRGASEVTHRATAMYRRGNSMAQRVFAITGMNGMRALVTPLRALNLRVSPGLHSTTHTREWSLLYLGPSMSRFSEFKERSLLPSQRSQALSPRKLHVMWLPSLAVEI